MVSYDLANCHPVLDVVVDDVIQLLVREAVLLCEHSVNFVNDGF